MAVQRDRPYGAFTFRVDLGDGAGDDVLGGFVEVSGLVAEVTPIDYRNGNEPQPAPRKLAGLTKSGPVTFKRGVLGSTSLWHWFRQTRDGAPERRTIVVQLLNEDRTEVVMTWKLRNAFPVKYEGPVLNALGNDVAIESLTVEVEGIDIE
jgi:phage tail-like protein